MRYEIDFGTGVACLDTPSNDPENRFYTLAGTCFGIRKSILYCHIISIHNVDCDYYEKLSFNGDEYVWREDGARKMLKPDTDKEWNTDYCELCKDMGSSSSVPECKQEQKNQEGTKTMTREEILAAAKACVCGEREQDYGSPEDNFSTIAGLWQVYILAAHKVEVLVTAKDVAAMMALLKIARIATGNNNDSFIALAGYAACAGEIAGGKR